MNNLIQNKDKEGKFIVIEGIDGCGSTTISQRITAFLKSKDFGVTLTHEPSEGPVGQIIRLALQGRLIGENYESDEVLGNSNSLDPKTLSLLYAADRADHTNIKIKPNLRENRIVISDRYLLSSLAYQGLALNNLEWILKINEPAITPDLTIFLNVSLENAKRRIQKDRWKKDIFEGEKSLNKVRRKYLDLVNEDIPELGKLKTVDVNAPQEVAYKRVRALIKDFLELRDKE